MPMQTVDASSTFFAVSAAITACLLLGLAAVVRGWPRTGIVIIAANAGLLDLFAGPFARPYVWVMLACSVGLGILGGASAWRAGGHWRLCSMPIGAAISLTPFLDWGYSYAGPHGALLALVVGWGFATVETGLAVLVLCAGPKWITRNWRASAVGLSVAASLPVTIAIRTGHWLTVGECVAAIFFACGFARGGTQLIKRSSEFRLWVKKTPGRTAATGTCLALALPAIVGTLITRHQPRVVHEGFLVADQWLLKQHALLIPVIGLIAPTVWLCLVGFDLKGTFVVSSAAATVLLWCVALISAWIPQDKDTSGGTTPPTAVDRATCTGS
jgi:hypothetical protein